MSSTARAVQRTDPAVGAIAISYGGGDQTPNIPTRGLYITVAGTLVVTMLDGTTATLSGLLAGLVYPLCVQKITAAGSTAAGFFLL